VLYVPETICCLVNREGERMSFKERLLWLPHNLFAHPLMVFLPNKWGNWIHNVTIPKISALEEKKR